MADRQPESKEFPVERAVFELPGGQLATEKARHHRPIARALRRRRSQTRRW